ncbi:MAG: DUF234 domain-containing protein [Lachnospiraceae bacterium]|nr:DUF234 domain-containing protein [Lachnospiraceae bacterium]
MNRTCSEILAALARYRDDAGNPVAVFYGSRYIDDDGIVRALVRNRNYIFYKAACVSDIEQRIRMSFLPQLRQVSFSSVPSYADLFSAIRQVTHEGERRILIFRDFEHLFYEGGDFLKELILFSQDPANAGRFATFLISDDSVWVENQLVARAGEYASGISGFIKKRESTFREYRESYPSLSLRDAISMYTVFGGETALWKYTDQNISARENIIRLFLEDGAGGLGDLAMSRLSALVREPAVYATILANLAAGREKLGELHESTGISRSKLSVYLATLMEPLFVEKVFSYGTVGTKETRKGVYRVANLFMRFYFRAIYPNESMLFGTEPERFYDMYVAPALTDLTSYSFRRICTEHLNLMNEQGRLPFAIAEEGEWNGKAGIIDIVAQSEYGETLAGMCSFANAMTQEDYHFLMTYAKRAGISPDHVYMFSGAGFDSALEAAAPHVNGLRLIDFEELDIG